MDDDEMLNPSPQECVGKTTISDDKQADDEPLSFQTNPPIKSVVDNGWVTVMAKGRRSRFFYENKQRQMKSLCLLAKQIFESVM
jgi:hypothetical protein